MTRIANKIEEKKHELREVVASRRMSEQAYHEILFKIGKEAFVFFVNKENPLIVMDAMVRNHKTLDKVGITSSNWSDALVKAHWLASE